jgi:hypothetical protein
MTARTRLKKIEQALARRPPRPPRDGAQVYATLPVCVLGAILHEVRRRADAEPLAAARGSRIQDLDLPAELKRQLADAFAHGRWRGDWVPLAEPERGELLAWLEANHARLDALVGGINLGQVETSLWNVLLTLRDNPNGYDGWAMAQGVRRLREQYGEGVARPGPAQ